jgi:hypothetical protein
MSDAILSPVEFVTSICDLSIIVDLSKFKEILTNILTIFFSNCGEIQLMDTDIRMFVSGELYEAEKEMYPEGILYKDIGAFVSRLRFLDIILNIIANPGCDKDDKILEIDDKITERCLWHIKITVENTVPDKYCDAVSDRYYRVMKTLDNFSTSIPHFRFYEWTGYQCYTLQYLDFLLMLSVADIEQIITILSDSYYLSSLYSGLDTSEENTIKSSYDSVVELVHKILTIKKQSIVYLRSI